jgi:hypothetical protein
MDISKVDAGKLQRVYEQYMKHNEQRNEWRKTEEGKAYGRKKAKEYYERNKEKVKENVKNYQKQKKII